MRILMFAAVAVSALLCNGAVAQQAPQNMMGQDWWGPMMSQGWMGHMMGQRWMGQMMNPSQHVEGRLAFLKTELKITDAQTAEWNAYADALRANAKRMGDLMNQMMSSGVMGPGMMGQGQGMMMQGQAGTLMSLPDRLNWTEQHMAAHMEMLQAVKEPTLRLYGVLSNEQKQVADQLLGPMGMMGMM
jgi:LTXXQ motif family protein